MTDSTPDYEKTSNKPISIEQIIDTGIVPEGATKEVLDQLILRLQSDMSSFSTMLTTFNESLSLLEKSTNAIGSVSMSIDQITKTLEAVSELEDSDKLETEE